MHYERWRTHGDPERVLVRRRKPRREAADIDVEAKACSTCKRRLPLDAFYRRSVTPDGLMYRCKDCCRDAYNERYANDPGFRVRRARHHRTFYERDTERRQRDRGRSLRRYGLTAEAFDALSAAQGGVCAICGRPPGGGAEDARKKRLGVDHDHATGEVRGLLCDPCNVALGLFQDDPQRLRTAIRYLQRAASQRGDEPLAEVVALF